MTFHRVHRGRVEFPPPSDLEFPHPVLQLSIISGCCSSRFDIRSRIWTALLFKGGVWLHPSVEVAPISILFPGVYCGGHLHPLHLESRPWWKTTDCVDTQFCLSTNCTSRSGSPFQERLILPHLLRSPAACGAPKKMPGRKRADVCRRENRGDRD